MVIRKQYLSLLVAFAVFWCVVLPTAVVRGGLTTFDCPMRQLAMSFAGKIQPFRSRESFQQLADALNGAQEAQHKCNVTPPTWAGPRLPPKFSLSDLVNGGSDARAVVVYVDPVAGSDTNQGSMSNPFKTINRALQATRAGGIGGTIVLRKGTHYLSSTIPLTSADNQLTIQNYPTEEVWISGATVVVPKWQPYNVSSTPSVLLFTNQNNVYGRAVSHGDTDTVKYLGSFDALQQCQETCLAFSRNGLTCQSFTYHEAALDNEWAKQCFAVVDDSWEPTAEANIESGRVVRYNIWSADTSGFGVSSIPGLRINGERAIRARYPNGNPEFGFNSELHAKSWLPQTIPIEPDTEVNPNTPLRTTATSFQRYQLGIGGTCKNFVPPAGYWCGSRTEGGGAFTYRIPSGMVADHTILPQSPYKDPTGAIIQAWRPGHWASWMFEVGSYDSSNGTFHFSRGGYQGARGENSGDNFYIENVFEELDSPGEWFFNGKTKTIYLWYNGTGQPPSETLFEVPQLKTLFTVTGTQAEPVKGIQFLGLGFKDAAYTYMDAHGMPSGGDWAFQRFGALFFSGTENITVDQCLFSRLDGNAIMISDYNRYATIQRSEFVWIGDTAIGSWGNAQGTEIAGMGWDGTKGDQPRFNQIKYNFVHELGIWEKQSSFYFQAKSCQNTILGNIFFNGPRAAINFNDGFGGASELSENLLLNTCRESGDHGPFNSWDRQVYVTDVLNGSPSVIKAYDLIHHNFIIADYNSQEAVDNDDGSCYYETHHNFLSYSGNGMKSDFGGHDNHHHDNVYAYVGQGYTLSSQLTGHEDYFYNNKVVLNADGDYGKGTCTGEGKTVVHDNQVFSPTAAVTECGMTLKEWQASGNDVGTTATITPSDAELLGWVKALLDI